MPHTTPLRRCPTCSAAIPAGALTCPDCGAEAPTEIAQARSPRTTPLWVRAGPLEARSITVQSALGADFEVRRLVGAGGFGEVWEAFDVRLQRAVAVKVLRPELAASPAFRERFQREARAVAQLRHPGIVPIYQVGEAEGLVYFIMPLVEGLTLKAALEQQGRLSAAEAVRILAEASSALREAHRRGIVHRDLKPENFMLEGPERRVVLMDFGIAQSEETDERLTGTGMVLGSPDYMSPEQATGADTLDARSDLYSLGVVAYRMLAGRLPFVADTAREVLGHHVLTPPEPPTHFAPVPPDVSQAVMRCLAKRPEERWQSAQELIVALGAVAPGTVESSRPAPVAVPTAVTAVRPPRVRRAVVGTGATLLVLVAAAWAVQHWIGLRRQERRLAAAVSAYTAATDSLRALSAAFRAGTLTGPQVLAARQAVLGSAEAVTAAESGSTPDTLDARSPVGGMAPGATRLESLRALLPGGPVTLRASGTAGCVMEDGPSGTVLRDDAPATNCWWAAAAMQPLEPPVEYVLTFRMTRGRSRRAGAGLAWCPAAAECRVLFLWSGGRAEWATWRAGSGLSARQLGGRVPVLDGTHQLRVRHDGGRLQAWLDGTVILERSGRAEAALLAEPGALRVVVQNADLAITPAGSLVAIGNAREER